LLFNDLRVHETAEPGDVLLVYHTYRGFLLTVTQEEHRIFAPAADAERLLGRLFRFNLTWGTLSRGLVIIPLLAIGNYYAQLRSIRKQSSAATSAGQVAADWNSSLAEPDAASDGRSKYHISALLGESIDAAREIHR
jgi:hypothetical protein